MKIIDRIRRRLAALDFELRFESDPHEMDHIATDRDRVERELDAMNCDGLDPDGKETRGLLDDDGNVIG